MKRVPARAFAEGRLLIDANYVHKIKHVDYVLPGSRVEAALVDQVTGEETRRLFDWNEHHLLDDPYTLGLGDAGSITVELARVTDDDERPQYRYIIRDAEGTELQDSVDLGGPSRGRPDTRKAMETLLGFLGAAAEARGPESENWDLFGERVREWATANDDALSIAQLELETGFEL